MCVGLQALVQLGFFRHFNTVSPPCPGLVKLGWVGGWGQVPDPRNLAVHVMHLFYKYQVRKDGRGRPSVSFGADGHFRHVSRPRHCIGVHPSGFELGVYINDFRGVSPKKESVHPSNPTHPPSLCLPPLPPTAFSVLFPQVCYNTTFHIVHNRELSLRPPPLPQKISHPFPTLLCSASPLGHPRAA